MDVGLIFAIVPRLLPAFMLALVALVGLLIQKKSFSDTIRGTIKTMAGVLILFIGVDIIVAVIDPITVLFGQVYQIPDAIGSGGIATSCKRSRPRSRKGSAPASKRVRK